MAKNVTESPLERSRLAHLDQRLAMVKHCSHGNPEIWRQMPYKECVLAGAKAAAVAGFAAAVAGFERSRLAHLDQRLAMVKHCSHGNPEFWRQMPYKECVLAGAKAAAVAGFAAAVPTIASARLLSLAKAKYLNPTAKALIVSTVFGVAYFIVVDKTTLASARKNSFNNSQH